MAQIDTRIAAGGWAGRPEAAQSAPMDGSAEIADLWRILRFRRALIAWVAGAATAAALAYGMLAPSLYAATAQILIDPRDKQIVSNDLNAGAVAPDGGVTQVESQVRVIESDSVLARAVAAAGLADDPEFGGIGDGLLSRLSRALQGAPDSGADAGETRAIRALKRRLAVKRADKVFVVDVIVTAGDPDKAARIVNAIAKAYLQDQTGARADAAQRASTELGARLDALRAQVSEAETRAERFKAENGLISASGKLIGEQRLSESNTRIVAARARVTEARARIAQVRQAGASDAGTGATPEAVQSAAVERLRAQFAELASKAADLRAQLGARHPYIAAVREQMRDVRRLIELELGRLAQSAEADLQRAVASEAALTTSLDGLTESAAITGQAAVRLRELEREAEASRAIYANYLSRAREIREQAGIDSTNARVIGWARPPQERSWPLRILLLVGGLVGGLGLGAGLAFVREYLDPTILSRRHLERLSGAPAYAAFPPFRMGEERPASLAAGSALDRLSGSQGRIEPEDRVLSVLVTSSGRDAAERGGATRLLAAVASARGARVLLVEADLTGPSGGDGFLDVLRGDRALAAAAVADHETGAARLRLGDAARPSRDALGRLSVDRFLAAAKARFDLVLIDGGALSDNQRLAALAASVDRLVVVARAGATRQRDLLDIVGMVESLGRPVSGSLLMGASPR